jgi:hypothetical protein
MDSLDLNALVAMRYKHQTRHAEKAVRTSGSKGADVKEGATAKQKEETLRRQLIRQFHAVLKEQQAQGAGTGVEHVVRWQPGDAQLSINPSAIHLPAGNAANAAQVASQTAKKVCRCSIYCVC